MEMETRKRGYTETEKLQFFYIKNTESCILLIFQTLKSCNSRCFLLGIKTKSIILTIAMATDIKEESNTTD